MEQLKLGDLSLTPTEERSLKSWASDSSGSETVTPFSETGSPFVVTDSETEVEDDTLVAVIGVGYVGEHLVSAFSKSYDVLGYDCSPARVEYLKKAFAENKRVSITKNVSRLADATHFLISVPTLLQPDRRIDDSYLRSALLSVGQYAKRGSTVVVESSVAVGMTRQLLGPLAKERGFFAGMSPERVDPGRTFPPAEDIPKIVSGLDDEIPGSLDAIYSLYSKAFNQVVKVSKTEVAEMTKLYENCQRMVNIAYANEMADACIPHGIDPFEVSRAAASKPFGYMPYWPGLGVGGHCIPVNPYYLLSNSRFPLLEAAAEKMNVRPAMIADRAISELKLLKGSVAKPRVLVVGMGFKVGQSHLVNSPGLELAKSLAISQEVEVSWVDPLVKQEAIHQIARFDEAEWTVEGLKAFQMIIVAFRQHGLDFGILKDLKDVRVEMWCV